MRSPEERLKLLARDSDDLKIISACLQDAVVCLGDITFLEEERRFALVLNRFMREASKKGTLKQVRSGIHFEEVSEVKTRGIDQGNLQQTLELLAVVIDAPRQGKAPSGETVCLIFAGGGEIRLEVERILCGLDDLSAPWPTSVRPRHKLT